MCAILSTQLSQSKHEIYSVIDSHVRDYAIAAMMIYVPK